MILLFVAPCTVLIPPNNLYNVANVNVPIDDTHTMFHFIAWTPSDDGAVDREDWRKFCHAQVGIDVDAQWRHVRTLDNRYRQDREAMKTGNFTGIPGIPNQDIAMWETMGPIADRTHDRLGASDLAIVEFRKLMVDAVTRFRDGSAPLGVGVQRSQLRAFEGVVAKGTDWRMLGDTAPTARMMEPDTA